MGKGIPIDTVHGTVVDVAGKGVFLRGPSTSGKSDLALQLIDRGAVFVADDQILFDIKRRGLQARAPERLYGLIEVRGLGILSLPAIKSSYIRLVVDLVSRQDVSRLPQPLVTDIEGISLPLIKLHAFDATAAHKVELALQYADQIGFGVNEHKKD